MFSPDLLKNSVNVTPNPLQASPKYSAKTSCQCWETEFYFSSEVMIKKVMVRTQLVFCFYRFYPIRLCMKCSSTMCSCLKHNYLFLTEQYQTLRPSNAWTSKQSAATFANIKRTTETSTMTAPSAPGTSCRRFQSDPASAALVLQRAAAIKN